MRANRTAIYSPGFGTKRASVPVEPFIGGRQSKPVVVAIDRCPAEDSPSAFPAESIRKPQHRLTLSKLEMQPAVRLYFSGGA